MIDFGKVAKKNYERNENLYTSNITGRINEFIKGKIAKGWRGVGGLVVQVHLVGGRQHAALCGVRLRFEQLDTNATRHRAH